MIVSTEDQLLAVMRDLTGDQSLAYDGPVRPLTGGFWAELLTFRLVGNPTGLDGPLVARLMPDAAIAAKETVVQGEAAAQGYPTPSVRLEAGPDTDLGRSLMVMDLADGAPLLDGLGGAGAIAALPRLARGLPDVLADALARLHALDVEPVEKRLDAAGITTANLTDSLVSRRVGMEAAGRHDLARAVAWLEAHRPAGEPDVVCHGDLHPFNVLVAEAGRFTVLDWSAALLAPAGHDIAFTSLLLAEPPVVVPAPIRPIVRTAGAALARRFRKQYETRTGRPIEPESLRWHEGVVCTRALAEVSGWVAEGTADAHRGHPWLISGPAFARRLSDLTGIEVRAR